MFKFIIIIILAKIVFGESGLLNSCISDDCNNNSTFVAALILARGGSKGIPKKNLVRLNGISLLGRTLKALHEVQLFSEIWVSTEDFEIKVEAKKYGALVHDRPNWLAQDSSSSLDSVKDFVSAHPDFEKIALFQCTSVFLTVGYIRKAFDMFKTKECVFSATRSYKLRWSMNKDGRITAMNFDPANRPRRQDWSGELVENGMFYFANRELIQKNLLQSDRCGIVEISTCDSLEIDTISDLGLAKCLLEQRQQGFYYL